MGAIKDEAKRFAGEACRAHYGEHAFEAREAFKLYIPPLRRRTKGCPHGLRQQSGRGRERSGAGETPLVHPREGCSMRPVSGPKAAREVQRDPAEPLFVEAAWPSQAGLHASSIRRRNRSY
ncbi:hypothetical protein MRX96_044210 [Rhipicephalus microplus]